MRETWIPLPTMLLLLVTLPWSIATAEEASIVLDPITRDYTVTYQGLDIEGNAKWHSVRFVPATKIEPSVSSQVALYSDTSIRYSYAIRNGRGSRQPIASQRMIVRSTNVSSQSTPRDWEGSVLPGIDVTGTRVNWSFSNLDLEGNNGLLPGRADRGFGIDSRDLPGITFMMIRGASPLNGFPDEGPHPGSPVYRPLRELMFNDFVRRHVAAPTIPVPSPFDASVVLIEIQKHLNQDLVPMKLVDPVLASQLDRLLAAAADAARLGNTKGAKENLKDFRRLLKTEHEDVDKEEDDKDEGKGENRGKSGLIEKLAARVLDFDAKYVLRRLGSED